MKKSGVELIAEERQRQIEKEGYTKDHDVIHNDVDTLATAAACYALPFYKRETNKGGIPKHWPFDEDFWKPENKYPAQGFTDRIRELQKAGALIAAEIDKLQAGGDSFISS